MLLTQRSEFDIFAFGHWESGELVRSIGINPVGGIWENIGEPEEFELPYWRDDHPVCGDYPLPFHPLEMGDEALRSVLGLVAEGKPNPALISVEDVPLKSWGAGCPVTPLRAVISAQPRVMIENRNRWRTQRLRESANCDRGRFVTMPIQSVWTANLVPNDVINAAGPSSSALR